MDGHCLTYFNHLTVRTPRMYANRAEASHSTHDPSRQRAEELSPFFMARCFKFSPLFVFLYVFSVVFVPAHLTPQQRLLF